MDARDNRFSEMTVKLERLQAIVDNIDQLRKDEGNTILIPCDNPDWDGPACFVEVTSNWTGWQPRRFTGDTLSEAIANAISQQALR